MIGERIKKIREFYKISQKDFAKKLGISIRTLQTYEQGKVESVPFPVLKDMVEKFDINLKWLFFGDGLMIDAVNENLQLTPYYSEALAIADNEYEIEECLKDFTKRKILTKIFSKNDKFLDQLLNIIFPKTQRLILFLYRVLLSISKDKNNENITSYKEFLISQIEKFDLLGINNIGHAFTKWDKNKLIALVNNLKEEECKVIIEDASKSIKILKENLDFLNKITY